MDEWLALSCTCPCCKRLVVLPQATQRKPPLSGVSAGRGSNSSAGSNAAAPSSRVMNLRALLRPNSAPGVEGFGEGSEAAASQAPAPIATSSSESPAGGRMGVQFQRESSAVLTPATTNMTYSGRGWYNLSDSAIGIDERSNAGIDASSASAVRVDIECPSLTEDAIAEAAMSINTPEDVSELQDPEAPQRSTLPSHGLAPMDRFALGRLGSSTSLGYTEVAGTSSEEDSSALAEETGELPPELTEYQRRDGAGEDTDDRDGDLSVSGSQHSTGSAIMRVLADLERTFSSTISPAPSRDDLAHPPAGGVHNDAGAVSSPERGAGRGHEVSGPPESRTSS